MALQPSAAAEKYPINITRRIEWGEIALNLVPLVCAVSHLKEEDYKEVVDLKTGETVRRANLEFTEGTLTAVYEPYGYRFFHPALKPKGSIFVRALNLDTSPGYSGVNIRTNTDALAKKGK